MSTSHSRARLRASTSHMRDSSQDLSTSSVSYPQTEDLILPDGPVGEETAELLQEFVHTRRHDTDSEDTLIDEDGEGERAIRARLPWWKRPAPWWLMVALPFATLASSTTTAPRIEVYTILACNVYKPEHNTDFTQLGSPSFDYNSDSFIPRPFVVTNFGLLDNQPRTPEPSVASTNAPNETGGAGRHCASDPAVQAAVAKLSTVMAATMGILSCFTTVWWGSFSDRCGRTRVIGISAIGLLLTDINFLFVSHFLKHLPGGYWFFLLGPVIEGCLAGMTSATHAYVSDTTDPGARSHAFSLLFGVLFVGAALGPTLGGILIRLSHNVLSVFYVSTLMHLVYAILVCFFIPESLFPYQMAASCARRQEELARLEEEREGVVVGLLVRVKRIFGFLSPLAILAPTPMKGENPLKCPKRDWNLTLVAAAYGFTITLMSSHTYKFQYAASTFHWSSEMLGYYISLIAGSRAVHLMLILPLAIKFLKPKQPSIELPSDAEPPSLSSKEYDSPSFDLNLSRVSLLVDVISFLFMGLSFTPMAFTLFGMLGSFGVGFYPGIHSVALNLYRKRGEKDNGRLFGALGVIEALSHIIGPTIFGFMYINTVRVLPTAIFFLSSSGTLFSFILLGFVRLPKETRDEVMGDMESQVPSVFPVTREETLVDVEPELDNPRADTQTNTRSDPRTNDSLVNI